MKKNYVLLSGLILASSIGFSQSLRNTFNTPAPLDAVVTSKDASTGEYNAKKNKFNAKAFGDTLFYEDFDGGLPTGWSIVNNMQNNFVWKWDTVYQVGDFSANTTAIKSTTASNGFMSLPSDFYNSGAGTRISMDTYIESDSITNSKGGSFPDAVFVTYQQFLRYCCRGSNRLVLQVSTDNFASLTEFDMTDDIPINASNTSNAVGGQTNVINISCALGGASSFKIRILGEELSAYYWMIDDFAVIEGPANNITLQTPYLEFNETNYTYYPFYGQIPAEFFPPLPFFGFLNNNGSTLQTNVELNVSVNHLNTPGNDTSSGLGNVYSSSQLVPDGGSIVAPLCDSLVSVLTGTPRFVPTVDGNFEVDFSLSSDSIDQIPDDNIATRTFSITDTVFARDDGAFGGGTGPASYVDGNTNTPGGTTVGDRFATMYILESKNGHSPDNIPTSVTYYVSADPRNIGVEIIPVIWEYNEDSLTIGLDAAFGPIVASSFSPYTVTSSDTSSFLTLQLNSGSALSGNGLDSGQYAVGWQVTTLPNGGTFEVASDATTAAGQVTLSTFVYLAHAPAAGWGFVGVQPVIRLNLGDVPEPAGLGSNFVVSSKFEVSPNPSNGEFKLNITTERATAYNLNVRNMLGQTVYTSLLNVNGSTTERLDLSGLEKGVYFVTLENENEKLLKKVVLK